ncbi:GDP-mannose 4,6-dehydratase [Arthrobacter crystallopoietes BAB-32]|uniref:GDP-mannose 4,6-dehydratase n=2 Tax=Crystallibacter crystallopoietes TaxID=37928 RepID=N1V7Y6_9MICC|nr:GDP-mannose 4,6-dehydratase [Arthrobacter crystallopoietes BAB-32]
MLQHDVPQDYVIATNTAYTVRDFLDFSFRAVGLDWQKYVKFDDRYLRPTEVDALIGDPSKAQEDLKWVPNVLTPRLAKIMVEADLEALKSEGSLYIDSVQTN